MCNLKRLANRPKTFIVIALGSSVLYQVMQFIQLVDSVLLTVKI